MMLEEGIVEYLSTVDTVTALVGQQIYGIRRPQGIRPLPEVLIFRAVTERQELFCGTNPLVMASMQIDSYADSATVAGTLARALRQTLRRFTGNMGGVYVDDVFLTNEFAVDDPEPGDIRMVQLYNFWYRED